MRPASADCSRRALSTLLAALALGACDGSTPQVAPAPPPPDLAAHCKAQVGEPRIVRVTPQVVVARGFDLANTTVIQTEAGLVVVDPGMTTARATAAREAFAKEGVSGKVAAVIFTHSHVDHVGGAKAWVDGQEPPPAIWATDAFIPHLFKQYGVFRVAEAHRGARQFGYVVDEETLPCISIGRRIDLDGALNTGMRLPTSSFSGEQALTIGGVQLRLVEAHGETHDQLFVWLPEERVLLPGDNYYATFPNLYTIRGTSARPVDAWINSLDAMRRLKPAHLVPSHTSPVSGEEAIQERLTAYRDGIAFVYDHVVRGANAGLPLDEIVASLRLPPHLERREDLQPLYGELSWSARGIYTSNLGWFDGEPEALYPLAAREAAALDVELIGADALLSRAQALLKASKPDAALHLLRKLRAAGQEDDVARTLRVDALRALAQKTRNTNGRAYLLTAAAEAEAGAKVSLKRPVLDDELLKGIPLDTFFTPMPNRLKPEAARDQHVTVAWEITDEDKRYWVTVRRGVAEVATGSPLPGTPAPVATIKTTGLKWRRLAVQLDGGPTALLSDDFDVEGDLVALGKFLAMFERGF